MADEKMKREGENIGSLLSGFFIGGLIGSAAALLAAPRSGQETRAMIRAKSVELKEKALDSAEETRLRAEQTLTEARTRAAETIRDTSGQAEELARTVKEVAAEVTRSGQEELEEKKGRLKSTVEAAKQAVSRR